MSIVKYGRKLLAVNRYDKEEKERLAREIREEENLTEKQWFLEQLESVQ